MILFYTCSKKIAWFENWEKVRNFARSVLLISYFNKIIMLLRRIRNEHSSPESNNILPIGNLVIALYGVMQNFHAKWIKPNLNTDVAPQLLSTQYGIYLGHIQSSESWQRGRQYIPSVSYCNNLATVQMYLK